MPLTTVTSTMTTRERIRATVNREPVDHLPLCFNGACHGVVGFLNEKYSDQRDRAAALLALGVDTGVSISPPFHRMQGVTTRQWREEPADERYPVLHREYATPRGRLRQVVRKTDDYPDTVRIISDHNVPASRSISYLVESEEHLDALEYLLRTPDDGELAPFRSEAAALKAFSDEHGILLSGYLAGVGDPLMWFSGVERSLVSALDDPGFMERYVAIIEAWNRRRLELMLDAGADIIVRRGWYESTDFWSPDLYRRFLHLPLKRDVALTHEAGALISYVMNSGSMPLLDQFNEIGFDIYSNIDPMAPCIDLDVIKDKVGRGIALCGGVNNNMVIERGTGGQVRAAVRAAVEKLGPDGFILAPGDSILATDGTATANFHAMIDEWKARW